MGLDLSHGRFHTSYSGFNRLRCCIAELAGFTVEDDYWGDIPAGHPLKDFLNHSDCDGELSPEQCKVIIPALSEILLKWTSNIRGLDEASTQFYQRQVGNFIEGMQLAIKANEPLEFR
jgi:hypothetical protein